jgi:hypothetical protein
MELEWIKQPGYRLDDFFDPVPEQNTLSWPYGALLASYWKGTRENFSAGKMAKTCNGLLTSPIWC